MRYQISFTSIVLLAFMTGCITDPILTSIVPPVGWEGQVVVIEGSGFGPRQGLTQVLFSGDPAGRVLSWSETRIEVAVPPGAQTGQVLIRYKEIVSNRLPFIVTRPPLDVVPVVRAYDLGHGYWPRGIDVGDFNEDGRPDIALSGPWQVSVLLNEGEGLLSSVTDYYLDDDGRGVIAADFDNDGHLDLASGGYEEEFYVLFGDGEGTFGDPIPSPSPWLLAAMASADFDEDGFLDLIVTFGVESSKRVGVYFGDGEGMFGDPIEFYVGYQPRGVTTGDYNGDGHMDAAITNSGEYWGLPDTVSIVFGDGQGGFSEDVEYDVGDVPCDIISVDFNGDGALDLAVANGNSSYVSILLNDGLGGFGEHLPHPIDGDGAGDVSAGDYNGDGIMDLAVAAEFSHHSVQILLGYGDGTFLAWDFIGNCCIEDIAQGDFDGDGIQDLVSANHQSDCVALLIGDGSGAFGHVEEYEGPGEVEEIVTGDFNEDGHIDLTAAQDEHVSLYFGDGEGSFSEPAVFLDGPECFGLVAGDWDLDGHLDLAVVRNYSLTILLGDGQGGFGEPQDYELGPVYQVGKCIDAADFNEDGILDLAVPMGLLGVVTIFTGDGTGGFPGRMEYDAGEQPMTLSCGDFNGDGHTDIAVAHNPFYPDYINDVSILYGYGQGEFTEPTFYSADGGLVLTEDIDQDGHLDLLLIGIDDPDYDLYFQVLKGNGDGTFAEPGLYFGAGTWLAVNDFNEDGLPDVAGVDWYTHHLFLSLGDGLGGFAHHADYMAAASPLCAASADFNEDGHADVAIGNDIDSITIFLGNGQGGFVDFN